VRRIVLDPGHGGKDPGASAFGIKEKDIVLQVAKKLAAKLKKDLGYEVILTRNDDTFISLEQRTAIANANGADLFISLHLNAHPSAKIFGFETYYLSLSSDSEAIRVAALENATSTHQLSDLQNILADIMKNSKIDESSRLAQQVQDALFSGLTDRKYLQVKNLGVKKAPFYVLIGAEMPAILIEMAFLSNKADATQMKKEGYQDALAAEIVHGLQCYIRTITASL
jgi:N-acetylmuramoyl-L-alanine amidase